MRHRLAVVAGWVAGIVVVLAAWRYVLVPISNPVFMAPPEDAFGEIQQWWSRGVLWSAVWITLSTTLYGMAVGGIAGVVLALLLGKVPTLRRVSDPLVIGLYAMPKIVLVPLVFLWFGRSVGPRVGFVALGAFAIMYLHTTTGLRSVPEMTKSALRIFGASSWQVDRLLVIPSASSHIAAGVSIAVPFALVTTLVLEVLLGRDGLGGLLAHEAALFNAAGVLAVVLMGTVLGLLGTALGRLAVRATSPGANR